MDIKWVDLGLVVLRIYSDYILNNGVINYSNSMPEIGKRDIVTIFIYSIEKYNEFPYDATTYREKMMKKGYYVGHHSGEPIRLKIKNKNEIHICVSDYNKIVWSYITKVILTIHSIDKGYLHIKAGAVEYKGKRCLLVGRGGAGKTEMIRKICENGGKYITNTHAIIDKNLVLGIDSNIRIRDENGEKYIDAQTLRQEIYIPCWLEFDKILWIKHRKDAEININCLSDEIMYENMRQFSEAIVNWELHEDIYDFYNDNPVKIAKLLHENDRKLYDMIVASQCYYVNLDIYNSNSFEELCRILADPT